MLQLGNSIFRFLGNLILQVTWIREYSDDPEYAFPGQGKLKTPDEELYRLRKENKDLKEERDILKKALSIFSKKDQ